MNKTIANKSEATSNENDLNILKNIQASLVDIVTSAAGLTIGSSSKKAIKIANTVKALIGGVPVAKTTAEVAFIATTHDVANGKYANFLLSLKADGTVTVTKGADADTAAAAVIPSTPANEVAIGLVQIHPTGTGVFDATSTDLDDATVVPNAVYLDFVGGFRAQNFAM